MRKKKIDFKWGDVFAVPLQNKRFAVGQILDQRIPNAIRISLYDELIDSDQDIDVRGLCKIDNLISLIEVTKEQLVYGVWKILGNKEMSIPISRYPNEQFRQDNWVNSVTYDAALAEDFLNAYYALLPWDDWYDPNFLDDFLVDKSRKPKNLILIKSKTE